MHDWRSRWRYLSYRCAVCGLLLALALGVLVFGYIGGIVSGQPALWPLTAALVAAVLAGVLAGVFVIPPYRRAERLMTLYLEGYAVSGNDISTVCALSPASWLLLEKTREILNPTNLFHLNKRQAQYLALQNQINPHFLYNTLESIRSEALLAGLSSVADMTEALATFFRYTITKVENLVSVEEELSNCETYFRIQKYRFGRRLGLEIRCAPEDREEIYRCRLPKLTMQPILENSIIHGTELKVDTGHLIIHLERTQRRLLIRISDDGVGMDEETLARLNERLGRGSLAITEEGGMGRGGLALANVSNRIRLLFGEEYGLHVFSVPGVGTDVEIALPAILSDREIENSEALQ